MYILIVEDDYVIRTGLVKLISKTFENTMVYEAENGHIALQQLYIHPEIQTVITDIKMPILDGIELTKIMTAKGYSQKIIILSGYDDFELVRTAMKNGALDYILKPLDINKLKALLQDIFDEQESEKDEYKSNVCIDHNITDMLIKGMNINEIEEYAKNNKILLDDILYLILLQPKSFLTSISKHEMIKKTIRWFHNIDKESIIIGASHEYICLIIGIKNNEISDDIKSLIEYAKEHSYTLGISKSSFKKEDLLCEVEKCVAQIENCFFDIDRNKGVQRLSIDTCYENLLTCILTLDIDSFEEKLDAYAQNLYHKKTQKEIRSDFNKLVYDILVKNQNFISIIANNQLTDSDIFDAIKSADTFSQLQYKFKTVFINYMTKLLITAKNSEGIIIRNAKSFIDENYSGDLTLSDVAACVFLHPNYFSTVFKNVVGLTFREYLRNVRIEKSKELMKDTSKKMYDIAYEVGYKDASQFNRAFKEVVKMKPKDYRSKL